MPTETLASADAILKDLYRGPIREQVNYKTYMLDMIERDSDSLDFTGRRAVYPVEMQGNQSATSFGDGGTLATPGAPREVDAIVQIRYHDAGLELADQLIKQARSNEGAFVNVLTRRTKRLAQDMRKYLQFQIFGDGTGRLASVTAGGTNQNTVTVDQTQYLQVNQVVDVLVRASGAAVTGSVKRTIIGINRTTKVVTFDAPIGGTTDNTFGLYKEGSRNLVSDGLQNFTGTGRTLHGIDSSIAGNEAWNGFRRSAGGAIAGESLFEQLFDDLGAAGQGEVEWAITTRGVRRRLADTFQSTKRFNDAKAVEIHGGYKAVLVNEVPLMHDDDCPKGWAFAGRNDAFTWAEVEEPDWLESQDGTIWHLKDGSTAGTKQAVWQAWWIWYAALACLAPNQTGAITSAEDD
jgi:hypothetical protein